MNIPFSFADILERIAPGAIFIFLFSYFFGFSGPMDAALQDANSFIVGALFLVISYSLGVVFNILAGVFHQIDSHFVDLRYKMLQNDGKADASEKAIRAAIVATFSVESNEESWKLCYGIAHKSQFGANIETFGRINIFCRSMMLCFLTLLVLLLAQQARVAFDPKSLPRMGFCVVMFFIFFQGSRIYSRAFSAAIYESFYTWYCTKADFKTE